MSDERHTVMASTFRGWWQSLSGQHPEDIARGNTLTAGQLRAYLAEIGKRNGAVVAEQMSEDRTRSPWPELNPVFDWNGTIEIGRDAPIEDIERATGISDREPLA